MRVAVPDAEPTTVVVLAKGLFSTMDHMDVFLDLLAAEGHVAASVEFEGPGGTWKVTNGTRDVVDAGRLLASAFPDTRLVLYGFSMGGQIALLAAGEASGLFDHVISGAGVTDLDAMWLEHITWRPLIEAEVGGTPLDVPERYASLSPVDRVDDLADAGTTSIHLIHALADTLVPSTQSDRLYEALSPRTAVVYRQVTTNQDAWVCAPLTDLCVGALPVGPGNHEVSVFGVVQDVLLDVAAGRYDAAHSGRILVDAALDVEVPLPDLPAPHQ